MGNKDKGKSKVSISTELQKLYWTRKLTIYNIQKLGVTRNYFTPCIK